MGHGAQGFHLQTQNARLIPPRGIRQAVIASPDTVACSPAPAAFADLRIVKGRQRFVYDGFVLHQWHLDCQWPQIENVANEIGMPRVFDAELHGDADRCRHGAKRHQALFAVRAMLTIDGDEPVGIPTQNNF